MWQYSEKVDCVVAIIVLHNRNVDSEIFMDRKIFVS